MSKISATDFSQFAASRRSTRDFEPTTVDPKLIEEIIADGLPPQVGATRGHSWLQSPPVTPVIGFRKNS